MIEKFRSKFDGATDKLKVAADLERRQEQLAGIVGGAAIIGVARNEVFQGAAVDVAKATWEGATADIRKKDGDVSKFKLAKKAFRPQKTVRIAAFGAAQAGVAEARNQKATVLSEAQSITKHAAATGASRARDKFFGDSSEATLDWKGGDAPVQPFAPVPSDPFERADPFAASSSGYEPKDPFAATGNNTGIDTASQTNPFPDLEPTSNRPWSPIPETATNRTVPITAASMPEMPF